MNTIQNTQSEKLKQLKKHKNIATIFFVVMALTYITTEVCLHKGFPSWLGYLRAFAEAAMVGALADWFAVTALFHHPLGLKIPHTNLIEKKQAVIGNNLGKFVTENFLTTQNIRPYIAQLTISDKLATWLESPKNRAAFIAEISKTIENILRKADDGVVSAFITNKGTELLNKTNFNQLLGNLINYLLKNNEQDKILNFFLDKIKVYVVENEELIKARVKKESGFFVPGFVDNILANRITVGLANYLHEIQTDAKHSIRHEINQQLDLFATQLIAGEKYTESIESIKQHILTKENMQKYATDIWTNIKQTLLHELTNNNSAFTKYIDKNLQDFVKELRSASAVQQKIDHWARLNLYKLILRNTDKVSALISQTVSNWKGNTLSEKLELEVGKDLQFIRINGTLVGGLVGLIIYSITQLF